MPLRPVETDAFDAFGAVSFYMRSELGSLVIVDVGYEAIDGLAPDHITGDRMVISRSYRPHLEAVASEKWDVGGYDFDSGTFRVLLLPDDFPAVPAAR